MTEKELEGEYLAISEVQEDEQDALLAKANVVGLGIGHKITKEKDTGKPSLTVYASGLIFRPQKRRLNSDVRRMGRLS